VGRAAARWSSCAVREQKRSLEFRDSVGQKYKTPYQFVLGR
jgi:hypothetical protein